MVMLGVGNLFNRSQPMGIATLSRINFNAYGEHYMLYDLDMKCGSTGVHTYVLID
jgi:hypothetical protein